jgi:hypothetical protein
LAYTLQAIIGKREVLEPVSKGFPSIELDQDTMMIPLTKSLRQKHGMPSLPLTDGDEVPESVQSLCQALSSHGRVAYLEAEFFGGDGTQAALCAERGHLVGHQHVSPTAINAALSFIGVVRGDHRDEFEAIALGCKRSTEEW